MVIDILERSNHNSFMVFQYPTIVVIDITMAGWQVFADLFAVFQQHRFFWVFPDVPVSSSSSASLSATTTTVRIHHQVFVLNYFSHLKIL